jgi:hypothetical protein
MECGSGGELDELSLPALRRRVLESSNLIVYSHIAESKAPPSEGFGEAEMLKRGLIE